MTPGDVLLRAVRDAVAEGEIDVAVPESVVVFGRGRGVFESPVALRLGVEPEVIARRAGGVAASGFVRIVLTVGDVLEAVLRDPRYGVARVPRAAWDEWPRTFDNPGFSVRYAYARACWVERWAKDLGIRDGRLTAGELESELAWALADVPGRAEQAERERDAGPLMFCLEKVAGAYHDVHERCPAVPKGDEEPVPGRVGLARAAKVVLGNGLNMIGETPRERI
ncbi:DALR anticodon-binding domain-containing protein [Actinomadura monticuli]|uniref:DALR anticodon-binding domain-containing protein n=1 Tax=Actinomadura monticuli TaxID=3097367 RepID=A0ABV4QBM3_9ACTN